MSTVDRYCYELKVYHANNLPKCDVGGKCDLYCILRLPEGEKPYPRTKVYHKDYNPKISETLYETGVLGDVVIELYDKDKYSDDFIGTVTVKADEFPVYRKTYVVNLEKGMKPHEEGNTTLTISLGRLYDFPSMQRHFPNAVTNVDTTVNPSANEVFIPFGESTFVGFRYEKILSCEDKEYSQAAESVHFVIAQTKTSTSDSSEDLYVPSFRFDSKHTIAYSFFVTSSPVLSGKAPVIRRIAKNPIYYEVRAPNFTFTPFSDLTICSSVISKVFSKRISELFKINGVSNDSYVISPDAYKSEAIKIKPFVKLNTSDDIVTIGASPLFYLNIKRDSPSNMELWIDDTTFQGYSFDIFNLASSTYRKVRSRLENKPFETINSHHRISFAENIPRLGVDKLEVCVSKTKKTSEVKLFDLFPQLKE